MTLLLRAVEAMGEGDVATDAPVATNASSPREWITRRNVLRGVAAATVAGIGGYAAITARRPPPRPPEVEALLGQAWQAWTQGDRAGSEQAIGLYRRATVVAPDDPDTWGLLGCVNADLAHWAPAAERPALRQRAQEAGRRALNIDRRNAFGRMAVAYARPIRGNWLLMEREFRQAISDQPRKWLGPYSLALLLTRTGRNSEAAELFEGVRQVAPTAMQYLFHIQALWAIGRLDEAERLLGEAIPIYGTHPAIWLTKFKILLSSGKAETASTLVENRQDRPAGFDGDALRIPLLVADAAANRDEAAIGRVVSELSQSARRSSSASEAAIEYASLLGRVDEAFEMANAYYFFRGYAVPDTAMASDVTLESRDTRFLFLPTTSRLRGDARFESMVKEIGLDQFWRRSRQPDYRLG